MLKKKKIVRYFFPVLFLIILSSCECEDNGITGMSGELWIGRTVVEFGRVCLGDKVSVSIAVENRGPLELRFKEVKIEGGGADRFTVVEYPEILERAGRDGSSGQIVIAFEPEGSDQVVSGLFIETDEIENPRRELSLRGEGDDGPRTDVVFSCESPDGLSREDCRTIMLGEIGVGATGEEQILLENRGCALLTANDIRHINMGADSSDEVFGFESPDLPFEFSNLEPVNLAIRLSPDREDAFVGRFEVEWEDMNVGTAPETTSINVIAQGIDMRLVVQPPRYTFGQATVDSPQVHTFTVRNLGNRPGSISGFDFREDQGEEEVFFIEHPEVPVEIEGLGEVDFDVIYAPLEAGQERNVVQVHTDVGILNVPVMGGVVPQIVVDPPHRIDFGFVEPGDTVTRPLQVANMGQANLVLSDVVIEINPADVFSISNLPELPIILEPEQDFSFDVIFEDNVTIANERGQLTIISDDPGYAVAGYLVELQTENPMVEPPVVDLEVFVDGEADTRNPVPVVSDHRVELDASGSTSHDGTALEYTWRILQSPANGTAELSDTSGSRVYIEPDWPGDWQIRVTVTDRFGLSSWENANLLVRDED